MFAPFDEEKAFAVCVKMMEALADGSLVLEQVTAVSEERAGNGLMLGALVAKDGDGREVELRTVSGISRSLRVCGGNAPSADGRQVVYVPPIVGVAERDAALSANDERIHALTARIETLEADAGAGADAAALCRRLQAERAALCRQSLASVYALYAFHCADGVVRSLSDVCRERGRALPPTGTGDCCAPKLLDYAFAHGLQPLSLCEVFYGRSSPKKRHGIRYAPCDERCGILLPAMLRLEILYRDSSIVVVNKPSGVLSVPGKVEKDCITNRLRRLFPQCIAQPAVHRLDMETSGVLVLALTADAHRALSRQFAEGSVQKRYVALVDGVLSGRGVADHGTMELYFRVDLDNRPHQIWDAVYGKKAVTEWHLVRVETYHAPDGTSRPVTRVRFTPHTGRTHQLRLAAASSHGFGVPIIGDTLYGTCAASERLMLHAERLAFAHPATGERMEFCVKAPF